MTKLLLSLLTALLFLWPARNASADECSALLVDGVHNEFRKRHDFLNRSSFHHALCRGTVFAKSSSVETGGGGGFTIGIPGVVEVGAFGSQKEAKKFQESYKSVGCTETDSTSVTESVLDEFRKTVDPTLVEGFVKCATAAKRGLRMGAQRAGSSAIDLTLRFNPQDPKGEAKFTGLYVSPKGTAKCESRTLSSGRVLAVATSYAIHCERQAPATDSSGQTAARDEITFSVHTSHGVLVASLPPEPPMPTSTELVMAALPSGTVLGWSRVGLPEGWTVCNGKMETPDLVGRYPLGLKEGLKLRQKVGAQSHGHGQSDLPRSTHGGVSDGWHVDTRKKSPHATGLDHRHRVNGADHTPLSTVIQFICKE